MSENEILQNAKIAYDSDGKCSFERKKYHYPGVYFIIEDNKVVYIGMSHVSCYKACCRHFQAWNDRKNANSRSIYSKLTTRIYMITFPREIASEKESEYIRIFEPKDNREYYRHYKKRDRRKVSSGVPNTPF